MDWLSTEEVPVMVFKKCLSKLTRPSVYIFAFTVPLLGRGAGLPMYF
jgi:hypothetical protein